MQWMFNNLSCIVYRVIAQAWNSYSLLTLCDFILREAYTICSVRIQGDKGWYFIQKQTLSHFNNNKKPAIGGNSKNKT